jgi:transposase
MKRRLEEIERSIERYFSRLDRVDREEPSADEQSGKLHEKIDSLKEEMKRLQALETEMLATADKQLSLNDPDARSMRTRGTEIVGYNVQTAVHILSTI